MFIVNRILDRSDRVYYVILYIFLIIEKINFYQSVLTFKYRCFQYNMYVYRRKIIIFYILTIREVIIIKKKNCSIKTSEILHIIMIIVYVILHNPPRRFFPTRPITDHPVHIIIYIYTYYIYAIY